MVLMLIASLNFARHFIALQALSLEPYKADPECQASLALLALSVARDRDAARRARGVPGLSARAALRGASTWSRRRPPAASRRHDYQSWPVFAPYWMLFLSCIVCSTGSTGGGIKMFRALLLVRQTGRELKLLIHPSAVTPVRIGGRPVPEGVGPRGARVHLPLLRDGRLPHLRDAAHRAGLRLVLLRRGRLDQQHRARLRRPRRRAQLPFPEHACRPGSAPRRCSPGGSRSSAWWCCLRPAYWRK